MARLKKTKTLYVNEHVEEDTGLYITVRKWLSRIHKVVALNEPNKNTGKDKEWTLDSDCKLIYAYLFNFGKCHGWNNIYPNYTTICEECGIAERTLTRKINKLSEIGLIDIIKNKSNDGKFDSNQYRVKRPVNIGFRKWYDVKGNLLKGKLYQFDVKLFKQKG